MFRFKQNILHLLPLILLILMTGLFIFLWKQSGSIHTLYIDRAKESLETKSRLILPFISDMIRKKDFHALKQFTETVGTRDDLRISIIAADGSVVIDSREDAGKMENHIDRPEIAAALKAFAGGEDILYSIRYSSTLARRMLYSSVPFSIEGETYILRCAISIKSIDNMTRRAHRDIILSTLVALAFIGTIAYLIFIGVTRPAQELKLAARQIAKGDLGTHLPIPRYGSIRELALALSAMAEQLKTRIAQITREKNERDAIFASLAEGVVMLDLENNILDINNAAIRILDLESGNPLYKKIHALVRNSEFEYFVRALPKKNTPEEMEFTLHLPGGERQLRIRGVQMHWGENKSERGLLLVIYDLTQIRKLENYRRDFIANLSHEIKTPLTAIRAAVETLQDGAIHDENAAGRFMNIISMHSERLNSLVMDILSLSSLECRNAALKTEFEVFPPSDPAATAIDLCKEKAEKRSIRLILNDDSGNTLIRGDRQLLEQAVLNLIDNAIKYAPDNTEVTIRIVKDDSAMVISVNDHGCGIPKEHWERLFERFYRVDKARSRKLGGTGLGLAIVKHIMQLHSGSVSVTSEIGKGSTFTLRLPLQHSTV